jgi:uncharacterized protein (DUF488 family)
MAQPVFSVGHSTHSVEHLLGLLKQHSITAICDVRSRPYSRMNPQFNREPLRDALRAEGIAYVFLGKELGARSDDRSCYRDGQVQYDLLAATVSFRSGLKRVREGSEKYRVALMCAEKDPLQCHRTILISRHLVVEGVDVCHILADGTVEPHEKSIDRLMNQLRLPQSDMFRSKEEIVADAYRIQGEAIAYEEKSTEDSGVA